MVLSGGHLRRERAPDAARAERRRGSRSNQLRPGATVARSESRSCRGRDGGECRAKRGSGRALAGRANAPDADLRQGRTQSIRAVRARWRIARCPVGRTLRNGGPRDPTSRWTPASYGPAPTPGHVDLRREAARDVLAACGIPATLFDRQADGTAMRESYRRLIFTTVQPWAALVQGELQDKLDSPELRISFAGLHGADLATRGRALKQLTESGVSLADAMAITGLAEGA